MIDVAKAIANATQAAHEFYQGNLRDLRLEEVQLSEDRNFWQITLGFLAPERNPIHSPFRALGLQDQRKYERVYKIFDVRRDNGEVTGMRIREV